MSYILTVDQPNLGDGGEIFIHGLGTFKNGDHKITDEQAQLFRVYNAHTSTAAARDSEDNLDDPLRGQDWVQVTGTELGPSLAEAAERMYGVTVREVDDTSDTDSRGPVDSATKSQATATGGV